MLEYYLLIRLFVNQPPLELVIILWRRANQFHHGNCGASLIISVEAVDLRQIDSRLLLESKSLEDNLLAFLCKGGSKQRRFNALAHG